MFFLLLSACTTWDGTWLFTWDPNVALSGDCADDDEDDDTTYIGETSSWVDIFRTGGGEVVVMLEQPLRGNVEDNAIEAEWDREEDHGTYGQRDEIVLTGRYEAGLLVGEVKSETWMEDEDGADYTCEQTVDYEAERTVSDADRYVGEG